MPRILDTGHPCGAWHQIVFPYQRQDANRYKPEQSSAPHRQVACGHQCQRGRSLEHYSRDHNGWHSVTAYCCCRCHQANRWFNVIGRMHDLNAWTLDLKGNPKHPVAGGYQHPSIVSGFGLRREFIQEWEVKISAKLPEAAWNHVGWHAGLRRPVLRYSGWNYRKAPIRVCDRAGVSSGPGALSGVMCPTCRSTLQTIPLYLWWVARGWPVGKAHDLANIEATQWRPGRRTDKVPATILDDTPVGAGVTIPNALLPW